MQHQFNVLKPFYFCRSNTLFPDSHLFLLRTILHSSALVQRKKADHELNTEYNNYPVLQRIHFTNFCFGLVQVQVVCDRDLVKPDKTLEPANGV